MHMNNLKKFNINSYCWRIKLSFQTQPNCVNNKNVCTLVPYLQILVLPDCNQLLYDLCSDHLDLGEHCSPQRSHTNCRMFHCTDDDDFFYLVHWNKIQWHNNPFKHNYAVRIINNHSIQIVHNIKFITQWQLWQ